MSRRVSKITAAVLFTIVVSLSSPVYAAQSRDIGDPDFGTRIVRVLKDFARHLGLIHSTGDGIAIPR